MDAENRNACYRSEVIKENRDFRRLYGRGKSAVGAVLVTYYMKSRRPSVRFGITVSKKIGSAVQRNRAKRVIREAFRALLPQIKEPCDLIFVARTRTTAVPMQEVRKSMQSQLERLGVLLPEEKVQSPVRGPQPKKEKENHGM